MRRIEIAAIWIGTVLCLIGLSWYARMHIRELGTDNLVRVRSGPDALGEWLGADVHGRILIHLDRHLDADPDPGRLLDEENYLTYAVKDGFVRKIYHVIPDGAWEEVARALSGAPGVTRSSDGFHFVIEDGVPVEVVTERGLPALSEPVLLNINGEIWTSNELRRTTAILFSRHIRADLITIAAADQTAIDLLGQYERDSRTASALPDILEQYDTSLF